MHWIAPSGKDSATDTLEKRLWDAADQFRANRGLGAAQYSQPVLGLIFLRFAEVRFRKQRAILERAGASSRRGNIPLPLTGRIPFRAGSSSSKPGVSRADPEPGGGQHLALYRKGQPPWSARSESI